MDTDRITPDPPAEHAALLTRRQAAVRLGTTERHVRRLVERGILTSVRLGGKVRIRTDDLDSCLRSLPSSHGK
jgi:excisionase family DNA binding protein